MADLRAQVKARLMVPLEKMSWRRLLRKLRNQFLTGIFLTVPIGIVILILVWLFVSIDNILEPVVKAIFGYKRHYILILLRLSCFATLVRPFSAVRYRYPSLVVLNPANLLHNAQYDELPLHHLFPMLYPVLSLLHRFSVLWWHLRVLYISSLAEVLPGSLAIALHRLHYPIPQVLFDHR